MLLQILPRFSLQILSSNSLRKQHAFSVPILRLLGKPQFQSILSKLVGNKEGVEGCEGYPEVCRSDLWINVFCLDMGCVLFYSESFFFKALPLSIWSIWDGFR